MMESLEWVNDFVGVPYLVNGRDRNGWDCWGLVLAVFQEKKNVLLPDWRVDPSATKQEEMSRAVAAIMMGEEQLQASGYAVKLDGPEHMAIVFVHRARLPYHVGVVVAGNILHCGNKTNGTVCEPLNVFLRTNADSHYLRWVG